MDVYKPFRAILFSFDLLRLLLLAASFALFSSIQTVIQGIFFPYLVYLSSNALFPMITLFLFLKPGEYRNYFPLYIAGKTMAVVLFYVWAAFSLPTAAGFMGENFFQGLILLGGAFFLSLGDGLSIFGVYHLNKKLLRSEIPESGANGGL